MVNTKVTLSGITLDNPVIPASGTFGYGYEFAELSISIFSVPSLLREQQGSRALATPPPVSQNVPQE